MIASDVSEGRMLVLPDDIESYQDEEGRPLTIDSLPIARAARMSMSFPFFFEPVALYRNVRRSGHAAAEAFFATQRRYMITPVWWLPGLIVEVVARKCSRDQPLRAN